MKNIANLRPVGLSLMALAFLWACSNTKYAGEWVVQGDFNDLASPEDHMLIVKMGRDGDLEVYGEDSQFGHWTQLERGDRVIFYIAGQKQQYEVDRIDGDQFNAELINFQGIEMVFLRKEEYLKMLEDPEAVLDDFFARNGIRGVLADDLEVRGEEASLEQPYDGGTLQVYMENHRFRLPDGSSATGWEVSSLSVDLPPKVLGEKFLKALLTHRYAEAKRYGTDITVKSLESLEALFDAMPSMDDDDMPDLEIGRWQEDGNKGVLYYSQDGEIKTLNMIRNAHGVWQVSWSKLDDIHTDDLEEDIEKG